MKKKLKITHFKILSLIFDLSKKNLKANQEGLYKILHGDIDEETYPLKELETFATLTSYSSKKICHHLTFLYRYGYIGKSYDMKLDEMFYILTEEGLSEYQLFNKRHKNKFKKHTKIKKRSIIPIKN